VLAGEGKSSNPTPRIVLHCSKREEERGERSVQEQARAQRKEEKHLERRTAEHEGGETGKEEGSEGCPMRSSHSSCYCSWHT
jgi:hypothetical protein